MELNEFQKKSERTLNYALSDNDQMLNCVMGMCGESGELLEIVKKYYFQGHDFNRQRFVEELGDVAFYLAGTCTSLGISLEEVCRKNIEKLLLRFPDKFTVEGSVKRVDVYNGE